MSRRQNQSISGTIQNLTDEGFDLESSLKEITDNSIGAGATSIRFFLDPINLLLFVMDNGNGMNKNGLTKLATLNDRKEVSEAKQGKYGQGVKLAFAYLSQLKGLITIISKSDKYDASKEDAINQIIIDFPEGIKTDNYNPSGETACTANKHLWEKFADTIDNPNTGTLIKIQMDKRICKELYKKIVSDSVQDSIIANVGLINYQFLSESTNTIIFSTYQVLTNNEPEITLQSNYENTEEDDVKHSSEEDSKVCEATSTTNVHLSIQEYNDTFWDAECSEDFVDYDVLPFCPIGNLHSEKIQKYKCAILQNSVKDINTIIFWKGAWHMITEQNVLNLAIKPTHLGSDISDAAKILKSVVKSEFYINLAHSDDWINTHKNILCHILDCEETQLPQPSSKDPLYGKLLSFIKGNYYSRNGTISLNSRQKARTHSGGDRVKNIFEDNIITLVEYPAKADREFGVTVKKYSTIEEIVHSSIRNVIYFLKKRWATDYNNNLKKLEKERLEKLAAEKLAAEKLAAEERKKAEEKRLAEVKRLAEIAAKQQAELQSKQLAEAEEKRKKEAEKQQEAIIKAQQDIEEESKRLSELDAGRRIFVNNPNPDKINAVKPNPQKTERAKNTATYLSKKDMCNCIKQWFESKQHVDQLTEVVNYLSVSYELYAKSIVKNILETLSLHKKVQYLLTEIEVRYHDKEDSVSVLEGAYVISEYNKYFNSK